MPPLAGDFAGPSPSPISKKFFFAKFAARCKLPTTNTTNRSSVFLASFENVSSKEPFVNARSFPTVREAFALLFVFTTLFILDSSLSRPSTLSQRRQHLTAVEFEPFTQ